MSKLFILFLLMVSSFAYSQDKDYSYTYIELSVTESEDIGYIGFLSIKLPAIPIYFKGAMKEEEVESEEEFVEMVQSAANEEELDELISSSNQEVISEVPTKYEVRGFNRKKLPMEQLEPYFTDHQLKAAINKHMNEHGPALNGVDYEEVVNL